MCILSLNIFTSLRRRQVSINETEVKNLRFRKLLPSNPVDRPVSPPLCDSKVCDVNNSVVKKCASPDVSLANIISEKRKFKPKTYRSSWITPKRFATPVEGDDVNRSDDDDDARQANTLPSKTVVRSTSARKEFRKQLQHHNHHQRSSSLLRNSRSRSSSSTASVESKVPNNNNNNSAKKQRLSDLFSDDDVEEDLTQPMFKETPVTKINNP
ncbi:unnamed protein product [Trichobilharzia szidati]|nr:unnamed protein product [Trichobilharzia szidati]